jgi:hypothetical protein
VAHLENLRTQRPERADPAPVPVRAGMPVELRALAVLLLLDLAVGIWMRLHAERWLSFFVTHLPVLGLAAAAWGVAPDGAKTWLTGALRALLARRGLLVGLWLSIAVLATASLLCSTVQVESVDPGVRTRLRVVEGDRTLADSARFTVAATSPLNRLTTPIAFRVWLPPTGRRVWVHGPGLATASRLVLPWIPTAFQYPDDFDSLATVAAVPAPSMLRLLADARMRPELTLRDGVDTATVLARAPLATLHAVVVGFPDPAAPDSATLGRWAERLRIYFTDTTATLDSAAAADRDHDVAGTLRQWAAVERRRSVRPIVVGDLLRWEVRRRDGTLVRSDTTRVTRAFTTIFLEP